MDCNICNFQLKVFQDKAHKIAVTQDECEDCGGRLISVTFKKNFPLQDGGLERTGCIVCDEVLNAHVLSAEGKNFRRAKGKGKGKGKSKGKGGKSKGKSKKNIDPRMTFDGFLSFDQPLAYAKMLFLCIDLGGCHVEIEQQYE